MKRFRYSCIVWAFENVVFCNTLSVAAGAVVQYFLSVRYAFMREQSFGAAVIFALTFFLNLFMQDGIIWLCNVRWGMGLTASKLVSISIPFLIIYFIRKWLYHLFVPERQEDPKGK